jgi:hypothetical protein
LLPLNYQEHPPPQVQWFTQIRMENIYNAKKNKLREIDPDKMLKQATVN